MLDLLIAPDDRLCQACKDVNSVTGDLIAKMERMMEIMRYRSGIGLAATQVGLRDSVFVLDVPEDCEESYDSYDKDFLNCGGPYYVINPKIVYRSGDCEDGIEGCLSLPGQEGVISRSKYVIMQYLDKGGHSCELKASALLARCIQHEYDHLQGILYIDYFDRLKRTMFLNKAMKVKRLLRKQEC